MGMVALFQFWAVRHPRLQAPKQIADQWLISNLVDVKAECLLCAR